VGSKVDDAIFSELTRLAQALDLCLCRAVGGDLGVLNAERFLVYGAHA
jgi:hypothetical protein